MANRNAAVTVGLMILSAPLAAEPVPSTPAPVAGPNARYCMKVEPATGSLIEKVKCWTREQWADQGVDVDQVWAREGVTVLE